MRVKRYAVTNECDGYGVELREVPATEQPLAADGQYEVELVITGDYDGEPEHNRTVLLDRPAAVALAADLKDFLR